MKPLSVVFVFLFLLTVGAVLAQSEALDGAGYPNTDYFQAHSFQEAWTRINETYQDAEDRYAGDQRALDAEHDRRNSRAQGDAAQEAVRKWYVQECRKLNDRRRHEYSVKEAAQTAVKRFYEAKDRRKSKSGGSSSSITEERLEQRDLPDFRNAELPTERREMPDFVNASPSVKRKLTAWQQEQQRHANAVKAIMHSISSELTQYLLQKDTFKDDPSILALEKKAHLLISRHYHEQLRQENARFEATATQLAE